MNNDDIIGPAFSLAEIRHAKTSQLIALLDGETLAETLHEAGADLTKEELAEFVRAIADEIDRRIPVPER